MFYLCSLIGVLITLLLLEPIAKYVWDLKQLRRFPNQNRLSGITNLAFVYEVMKGFRSQNLHKIHEQHPIVRLGPNSLSFSSPNAIRDIYGYSTTCSKGDLYVLTTGDHSHILNVVDRNEHGRKRRYISHAFATRNLETWVDKITDKISRLIRQFDQVCDDAGTSNNAEIGQVDMRKWTNLFTIDAIADIAVSSWLGCLDRGNDGIAFKMLNNKDITLPFIPTQQAGNRIAALTVWSTSYYKLLRAVFFAVSRTFRLRVHQADNMSALVKTLVRDRVHRHRQGEDLDDIIRFMLEDNDGRERGLDIGEIEAAVGILLDAGSDTTAVALTHVIYNLLRTPDVMKRLQKEVDEALVTDNNLTATWNEVKNLPYLRACLDESLRLFPPVSMGLNRKTPPDGAIIDGHWIPGNTTVGVPAYTAHRNPQLFPDYEIFLPERWLKQGSADLRTSFIPFSTGSRGCIGRNITYIEQSMLLATLVHRYSMALLHPTWKLQHEEGLNLWPGPLPVVIQRRNA